MASLLNKTEDVANDNNITDSDIFGIGETWMKPSGTINFAGYTEHLANYGKGKGVCSFSRMQSTLLNSVSSKTASAIHLQTEVFDVIFVYLSSDCNRDELFGLLDTWVQNERPTLIMVDVNMDFLKNCRLANF